MTLLPGKAATAALVAAVALAGCGGSGEDSGSSPASAKVTLRTFTFAPDPVEIEAGTEVTWTNEDETTHDVTAGVRDKPEQQFGGTLDPTGGTYSASFDEPGTFDYFCSIHSGPGMEAQVVVE